MSELYSSIRLCLFLGPFTVYVRSLNLWSRTCNMKMIHLEMESKYFIELQFISDVLLKFLFANSVIGLPG